MDGGEELTGKIIGCIIRVHRMLGPGFLENVYRRAMTLELRKQGLATEVEREVAIYYDGQEVGRHRIDLIVEQRVIVELKAVEALSKAHYQQVRSYLHATGLRHGLLVNFSEALANYRRIDSFIPPSRAPAEADEVL